MGPTGSRVLPNRPYFRKPREIHIPRNTSAYSSFHTCQLSNECKGLVNIGGFTPANQVHGYVEPGSMNFILGRNCFFGYFFSESDASAPHRDSPCHFSEPGPSLARWPTYYVDGCPDSKALDMQDVTRQLRERHGSWATRLSGRCFISCGSTTCIQLGPCRRCQRANVATRRGRFWSVTRPMHFHQHLDKGPRRH